jgi:hypothetical protein
MKPIGLLVRRGGCRFDQKAANLLSMTDTLLVVYDAKDEALQRLGGIHPTDGYLSIPAIMIPFHTVEIIQTALATSSSPLVVTATISTTASSSLTGSSSQWIDIALTEWEENDENHVLQLEGLKLKYASHEPSSPSRSSSLEKDDLMAWLERKRKSLIKTGGPGQNGEEL